MLEALGPAALKGVSSGVAGAAARHLLSNHVHIHDEKRSGLSVTAKIKVHSRFRLDSIVEEKIILRIARMKKPIGFGPLKKHYPKQLETIVLPFGMKFKELRVNGGSIIDVWSLNSFKVTVVHRGCNQSLEFDVTELLKIVGPIGLMEIECALYIVSMPDVDNQPLKKYLRVSRDLSDNFVVSYNDPGKFEWSGLLNIGDLLEEDVLDADITSRNVLRTEDMKFSVRDMYQLNLMKVGVDSDRVQWSRMDNQTSKQVFGINSDQINVYDIPEDMPIGEKRFVLEQSGGKAGDDLGSQESNRKQNLQEDDIK